MKSSFLFRCLITSITSVVMVLASTSHTDTNSSEFLDTHVRGRLLQQYCGGGNVGNGVCADRTCCSRFGWCGTTPAHCSNTAPTSPVPPVSAPTPSSAATCGGGKVGNGVCADGTCCSQFGWCGTTPQHCSNKAPTSPTPRLPTLLAPTTTISGTCGGGSFGNGVCANGMCCSRYGWCGTSADYCSNSPPTSPTSRPPPTAPVPTAPAPTPVTTGTCGQGSVGNGICANGMCCSQYGWCGTTAQHCAGRPPTGSSPTGGTGGSTGLLTLSDLQKAIDMYNSLQGTSVRATQTLVDLINESTRKYSLYRRIAFVAHTIWESGAYVYTEELDVSARGNYQTCDWNTNAQATNGKQFYGRGYMQLSWCANYKAYGRARMVNGDPDYFYNNPELVATTYRMDSAAWFFEDRVKDDSGHFGLTTKDINGPIECKPSENYPNSKPKKRYQIFESLANKMGLTGFSESGCYN